MGIFGKILGGAAALGTGGAAGPLVGGLIGAGTSALSGGGLGGMLSGGLTGAMGGAGGALGQAAPLVGAASNKIIGGAPSASPDASGFGMDYSLMDVLKNKRMY